MKITRSQNSIAVALLGALALALNARADDINNEYRSTVFPSVKLTDELTGFGYLGYVDNPDKDYWTGYLGAGGAYVIKPWLHVWAGLIGTYTDNEAKSDKLELRPFIGPKLFAPNPWKWAIYNFTRYEWREFQDQDTDEWSETQRIRSRFGVEAPLTSVENAWKPKTWYALADVESFYNFDKDEVDLFRWRAGIGRVVSESIRAELIYHMQYTRGAGEDDSLEYTDNIIRLNIKIAFGRGEQADPSGDADD